MTPFTFSWSALLCFRLNREKLRNSILRGLLEFFLRMRYSLQTLSTCKEFSCSLLPFTLLSIFLQQEVNVNVNYNAREGMSTVEVRISIHRIVFVCHLLFYSCDKMCLLTDWFLTLWDGIFSCILYECQVNFISFTG